MLTRSAIGNLINRYKAVLKKCHLINTFGSLAIISMLVMSGSGIARAADYDAQILGNSTFDKVYSGNGILSAEDDTLTYTFQPGDTVNTSSYASISSYNGNNSKNIIINDIDIFNDGSKTESSQGVYVYNPGRTVSIGEGNITNVTNRVGDRAVSTGILLFSDGSELTKGDGDIEATASVVVNGAGDSGIANGVDVEYGGAVNLKGGNITVNVTTTGSYEHDALGRGFYVSGFEANTDPDDPVEKLTKVVKGDGNIFVTVNAGSGSTNTDGLGVFGEGKSDITIGKGNIVIRASNETGAERVNAVGIQLFDSGKLTKSDGTIDINAIGDIVDVKAVQVGVTQEDTASVELGVMNVTASGTARTPGYSYVKGLDATGNGIGITMEGGTLNITAENAEATGISAISSGISAGTTADLSISVASDNAVAVEAQGEQGNVVLGNERGNVTIKATGEGATGIRLADEGTVTLKGNTIIDAQTYALSLVESVIYTNEASLVNEGSLTIARGTVDQYTGSYTQASGSTDLGADSKFFGGDVVIEKGALTVNMANRGGVSMDNDQAMLALGQGITLNRGQSLIIGNATSAPSTVAFGGNSLLVIDGSNNVNPFIIGSGNLSAEEGSKLYIANAKAGEAYTITKGLNTTEGEYWNSADLLSGRLIEAEINQNNDGDIVVDTKARDAATVLPGIIPVTAINTMVANNLNDVDSDSMGIRFLSRALDETFIPTDSQATDLVNEVSRAAVTAGVQNTALRLADAGVDQLTHHLSLSSFGKENCIHKDGVDVWATPMYGNTYTHGMAASGTSVRGNYGGMTLGADVLVGEIMGGKVRVGAAINGGGGKSETRGAVTSTDNEYNFGGVNLYAGWNLDNLNVMASVGYAMANHDVKMNLPAAMGMDQAKADVDTNAFIADMRAEYQINTSVVDILPHAGVRYTALNTESYDLNVNGSTLNSVASDTQHIVQFPIGVTVTKDINVSGWNVKPQFDVSVIPAAGDKKSTTKVSYAGIDAMDSLNTRIMDSTSWSGMLGVQAEKGNFALGLNYGIQASSHETDQGVRLTLGWKF